MFKPLRAAKRTTQAWVRTACATQQSTSQPCRGATPHTASLYIAATKNVSQSTLEPNRLNAQESASKQRLRRVAVGSVLTMMTEAQRSICLTSVPKRAWNEHLCCEFANTPKKIKNGNHLNDLNKTETL